MNYIKTIGEEKLEEILGMDRSWDTRPEFENYSLVDDIIKNYIA
jgi:hypothetical protein